MKYDANNVNSFLEFCKNTYNINIQRIRQTVETENNVMQAYIKVKEVHDKIYKDMVNYRRAEIILQEHYNQYKVSTLKNLQERLNSYLNVFFTNTHNLKFKDYVSRGKTHVELVELNNDEEEISGLDILLSDAEQQMFGFLIQQIILANVGVDFLILDEAFSSFGYSEIEKASRLVNSFSDIQMLMIEHKHKLFNSFKPYTIVLERDNLKGTQVKDILNDDNLDYTFYEDLPPMEFLAKEVEEFC